MKIYNYTVFMALMMVLFYVAGFQFTFSSEVLKAFGIINAQGLIDLSGLQSSTFFIALASLFALGSVGMIAGMVAGFNFSFILRGLFIMPILVLFVGDLVSILNLTSGTWVFWIIAIILIPLIVGYAIALSEYWDGRD